MSDLETAIEKEIESVRVSTAVFEELKGAHQPKVPNWYR